MHSLKLEQGSYVNTGPNILDSQQIRLNYPKSACHMPGPNKTVRQRSWTWSTLLPNNIVRSAH